MIVKERKPISEMGDNLMLITDSHEIGIILDHLGIDESEFPHHSVAFVDTQDGEYSEVWIAKGCVPYNYKDAKRLV